MPRVTTLRPLIALGSCLIALALPVVAARGASLGPVDSAPAVEERPPDLPPWLIASRLGRPLDDRSRDGGEGPAVLSDVDAVLSRDSATVVETDPLTIRTSGDEAKDLRALVGRGEPWRLVRFGADAGSGSQNVKVTAYGAVAYVPNSLGGPGPDAGLGFSPASAPGYAVGIDDREEPISLGFKAELNGLEGGAEYRSVGKSLDRVVSGPPSQKDKEGTEVWLAQWLGRLQLRLSQSALSDNVDRNPALPRTSKTQTAVSAKLAPVSWPIFGLTYATGDSERSWLTGSGQPRLMERQAFDSVAGSVYYGTPRVDLSASSTYGWSRDLGRPDQQMSSLYHDLQLTLRPITSVSVTPAVSTGLDRYQWSGTLNHSDSASLLLTYAQPASWWSVWTLGAYTKSQATDRTVDGRSMSMSGGVSCGLGRLLGGATTMSFQAGYDRYDDSIYPDSSSRGVFGLVLLKMTTF
jgi:hypothetical protein